MWWKKKQPEILESFDYSRTRFLYANQTCVVPTNDEVVFEFRVRPLVNDTDSGTVERIYVNFYTAKRFCYGIHHCFEHHESVYGKIPVSDGYSPRPLGNPVGVAYANLARITPGHEEALLEFGIHPQAIGADVAQRIHVHTQVTIQYPTLVSLAKQLVDVLNAREAKYGVLEIDINKRLANSKSQRVV